MKEILMAIGYSKEMGGAQKVFISTINEISNNNCRITVILPNDSLKPFIISKDVIIHIVNFSSLLSIFKIFTIIRTNKFDVINTYLTKSSLLISFINLFTKKTIYCTLLNAIIHEKLNCFQKIIYPKMYFFLSKICSGFIVNSEQNKNHFLNTINIKSNFIKVIYSGIDVNEFKNYNKIIYKKENVHKIVIGYIGRLSIEKGAFYLLESLTQLHDIDYECLIIGDGPTRTKLETYARNRNLVGKVTFLGYQQNVVKFLHLMDIVVVPSLNETFGLSIVEAFALKKAVIATDVGGIPEIIENGVTGILIPSKNSTILSEKIRYLSNNNELINYMGTNAYKYYINNFTSKIMAKNTYDYITNNSNRIIKY